MMKYRVIEPGKRIKAKRNKRLGQLMKLSEERDKLWDDPQSKLSLIQALIPLGLKAVEESLQEEIAVLVGERYERSQGDLKRWGSNPGSVFIGGQKTAVRVPRVRNTKTNEEVPLESYHKLQS